MLRILPANVGYGKKNEDTEIAKGIADDIDVADWACAQAPLTVKCMQMVLVITLMEPERRKRPRTKRTREKGRKRPKSLGKAERKK